MQTLDRPEVEVSPRPRSPAILILLAALLVVAVLLAGWLFVENRSLQSDLDDGLWWPAESELTTEQLRILDVIGPAGAFITAFGAGDIDATLSLFSPEATWVWGSTAATMADGSLRSAIEQFFDWGWDNEAEILGVAIHGNTATFVMDTAAAPPALNVFTFDEAGSILQWVTR